MSITVASRKAKGRNLQKWVAQKLAALSGLTYTPGDDESEIDTRPMGQAGVDIILRGMAAKMFPFAFECKNGESFQLVKSIEQARANSSKERPWIIVHKRKKFRNPIVVMDWETFENLLKTNTETT